LVRSSEALADPTTALALELAARFKARYAGRPIATPVSMNLATAARVARTQRFSNPHFLQHFSLVALDSLSHTSFGKEFTRTRVIELIGVYLNYIKRLSENGYVFRSVRVRVASVLLVEQVFRALDKHNQQEFRRNSLNDSFDYLETIGAAEHGISDAASINETMAFFRNAGLIDGDDTGVIETAFEIIEALRGRYPEIEIVYDVGRKAGLGNYRNVCFHVDATTAEGKVFTVADGGDSDWGAALTSDDKLKTVFSGFGLEVCQKHFRDGSVSATNAMSNTGPQDGRFS